MNFLKKWMSTIISFVADVCGLALSACTGMKVSGMIDASALESHLGQDPSRSFESITKAYKVLTDGDLYTQAKAAGLGKDFMVMKVFAIITLVVSILLIAYAIVMLLKNLNVIKCESKIFDIVGICLFVLLLVATIGLLVSSNAYANAMEKAGVAIAQAKAEFEAGLESSLTQAGATHLLPMVPTLSAMSKITATINIGFYQPAMLVISIVSTLVYGTFTFLKLKKEA